MQCNVDIPLDKAPTIKQCHAALHGKEEKIMVAAVCILFLMFCSEAPFIVLEYPRTKASARL